MMNVFKRKSVYAAVLAGLGAVGVAGSASAVHINPDGLGQVLIYPYYTVRDGNDTYLSVVNTTASTKAIKVRFLEGKNSREVLDFNLYLSPNDVWTGAVTATASGARLETADKSCTSPAIPAVGQAFVNYAYTGTNADGESTGLDRTREGYIEIIEMGDVINATYVAAIKHSNGVPKDCATVETATMVNGTDVSAPSGGLGGSASLVATALGTDYSYNAVAIDNWSALPYWTNPDSLLPNIGAGNIFTSNVFRSGGVTSSTWLTNSDAVSAVMMHDFVINEFMLDQGTLSTTDWVVTMPTKSMYVSTTAAAQPFKNKFGAGGSCDPISLTLYDREEGITAGVKFSPLPPGQVTSLCWEANVVTFNAATAGVSNTLGSTNVTNIDTAYQNGWLGMGLKASATVNVLTSTTGGLYYGLPVVGFAVQDFTNNNAAPGVMATYGGNFDHKFTRDIVGQ